MRRLGTLHVICCFAIAMLYNVGIQAQNETNMPYSQYGIGQSTMPYNMPFAASLGGATYTLTGSNYINPFNPASYASIQGESFVFDMGLNIEMSTLKDQTNSLYDAEGNVAYLNFGMPLTKWWKTAFGLMPYSNINYESVVSSEDSTTYGSMKTLYSGTGGVSKVFWGHAFSIIPERLAVGFNANLLTGNVQRAITYDFQGNDSTYFMNSSRYKATTMRNLTFDFGMQYFHPISEKHTLGIGVTVQTPRTMQVRENALIYTFVEYASDQYICDTIFPHPGDDSEFMSTLEQPLVIGLGVSLANKGAWMVAADATFAPWNGLKYTEGEGYNIFGTTKLRYDKWSRYALGVERSGNKDANKYFRRISWRAGVSYEQGCLHLMLNEKAYSINEIGIGAGVSMPMRKGRSLLNLSMRYSRYGSPDPLQRNCFTVGISVGSCENWFVKRKYD